MQWLQASSFHLSHSGSILWFETKSLCLTSIDVPICAAEEWLCLTCHAVFVLRIKFAELLALVEQVFTFFYPVGKPNQSVTYTTYVALPPYNFELQLFPTVLSAPVWQLCLWSGTSPRFTAHASSALIARTRSKPQHISESFLCVS